MQDSQSPASAWYNFCYYFNVQYCQPNAKNVGHNFFSCFSSVWKNSLKLILLEEMVKRVNESLTATFFWQDRLAKVITHQLLKISKTFAYKRRLDIVTTILATFFSSILSARCTKCHFQFLFLFFFCVKKYRTSYLSTTKTHAFKN